MTRIPGILGSTFVLTVASAAVAGGPSVQISEIRIDQPGTDNDEYFELAGTPGASLDGLTYLVIGDGTGASGTIEAVVSLNGNVIDANGFFVAAEGTFTLGIADLTTTLDFENGDNVTHLLVSNFTGANGDDLDLDDDGTLDVTPWDVVIDAIGLIEETNPPVGTEFSYGAALGFLDLGPDDGNVPAHAYRCQPRNEWSIGAFDPLGGDDTPNAMNGDCAVVLSCGDAQAGSCFEANGSPFCDEIECCETVCASEPFCCETDWDAACVALAERLCLVPGEPPAVLINEIRIDQFGADLDQYFELTGAPATSLTGVTYIVVGDGTGGCGVIEEAVDLTGFSIDANGFFVAGEATMTIGTPDLAVALNFENGDTVTHRIVFNFTGAIGDDLDLDDDGVMDVTPWTAVIDTIALLQSEATPDCIETEWAYGPTVGPDGAFVPGHVYRCTPDGDWKIGEFDVLIGDDTPNAANPVCVPPQCGDIDAGDCFIANGSPSCDQVACCNAVCAIDLFCCEVEWDQNCADTAVAVCQGTKAPAVVINEVRVDQPGADNDEYFELKGDAFASLNGVTYLVIGDGSGGSGTIEAVVDLSGAVLDGNGLFVAAEASFSLVIPDLIVDLNFENSDNVTHLIVFNFSGADGDDLDVDDDGVIDVMPWETLLDAIGLVEEANPPVNTEFVYGADLGFEDLGPDGMFVPGHAYRCTPDGTWTIGSFDPAGGQDTPRAENVACGKEPVCVEDLDGDLVVGPGDLAILLASWGSCPGCPADFDADDTVGPSDLAVLLAAWGNCP